MRKPSFALVREESSFFRASQVLRIDGDEGGLPTEEGAGKVIQIYLDEPECLIRFFSFRGVLGGEGILVALVFCLLGIHDV